MSNHFHLLIQERDENIGETIKRIAGSYVYYYNKKYGRDGHLFKERFKSQPVNDMAFFITLLRYIHQNPVKAGIAKRVENYNYSSWGEYDGEVASCFQVCSTNIVLNRISFTDLKELVDEPLDDDVNCIDIEDPSKARPSDDQVWQLIKDLTGVTNSTSFQKLEYDIKRSVLKLLKDKGASFRQLERLTGIGRGLIQKL